MFSERVTFQTEANKRRIHILYERTCRVSFGHTEQNQLRCFTISAEESLDFKSYIKMLSVHSAHISPV